jgi:hypothetical protein
VALRGRDGLDPVFFDLPEDVGLDFPSGDVADVLPSAGITQFR